MSVEANKDDVLEFQMEKADDPLWGDNNEPTAIWYGKTYRVANPGMNHVVYVTVGKYGAVDAVKVRGDFKGESIYKWLEEWDFIERHQVGPDPFDTEYFASEKLKQVEEESS